MAKEEGIVAGGKGRPIQKRKMAARGWTKQRRATFLKVLAETCNVSMAGRAAGTLTGAYQLRHRDPAFALLWDEALAIGYDRLETMLLQRALAGVNAIDVGALVEESDSEAEEPGAERDEGHGGNEPQADATGATAKAAGGRAVSGTRHRPGSGIPRDGLARTDVQLALALLNRRGDGKTRQTHACKLMTSEEVDALLIRKLDGLARKLRNPA